MCARRLRVCDCVTSMYICRGCLQSTTANTRILAHGCFPSQKMKCTFPGDETATGTSQTVGLSDSGAVFRFVGMSAYWPMHMAREEQSGVRAEHPVYAGGQVGWWWDDMSTSNNMGIQRAHVGWSARTRGVWPPRGKILRRDRRTFAPGMVTTGYPPSGFVCPRSRSCTIYQHQSNQPTNQPEPGWKPSR